MRIITVANQKGGTGKTTTVQYLGVALAQMGRVVLIIDMDKQFSLTRRYGVGDGQTMAEVMGDAEPGDASLYDVIVETDEPRLFIAPGGIGLAQSDASFSGRAGLREGILLRAIESGVGEQVDYILLDTSPGLGWMLANALVAADEVIVPTRCNQMDLEGLDLIWRTIDTARQTKREWTDRPNLAILAILPTFYESFLNVHKRFLRRLRASAQQDNLPLAPLPVPKSTIVEQAQLMRHGRMNKTALHLDPEHPVSIAYQQFAEFVDHVPETIT